MNNYNGQDVMEIDLIDLCKYLFKQWKVFVAVALIGAAVALAYNVYQVKTYEPYMLSDYVAKLDDDDIREFDEDAMEQYNEYVKILEQYDIQMSNRMIMSFDPQEINTLTMRWNFEADTFNIDSVGNYFTTLLRSDKTRETLINTIGNSCTETDLGDIYGYGYSLLDDQGMAEDGSSSPAKAYLSVTFITNDVALREKIKDVVAEIINKGISDFKSAEYTISDCEVTTMYGYSGCVLQTQNSIISSRASYLKNVTDAKEDMSDDEIYYADYIRGEEYQVGETARMHYLKYPVIGAFLFCCVVGVYYLCKYIFGGEIKTIADIENLVRGRTIASHPENTMKYIVSAINAVSNGKAFICEDQRIYGIDELNGIIAKKIPDAVITGSLDSSEDAIDGIIEAESVILVVGIWKTSRKSVQRQVQLVEKLGKEISGIVVFV